MLAAGTAIAALAATAVAATAEVAAASSAPTAVTGPASALTATTATLSGNVNPNGEATSWSFEYGTTTGYPDHTGAHSLTAGTSSVAVSLGVSGLAPSTTYHFRLVATSSAGTSYGADATFKTAGVPPAAVTDAASAVSLATATLNGSVNPKGAATSWYFEYGTTAGYGSTTPVEHAGSGTAAVDVHAGLAGLVPGTVYHFRLVATNAAGTSSAGDVSFKTAVHAPGAATDAATGVDASSATLDGAVDPEGLSTVWRIRYGTTSFTASTAAVSAGSGLASVPVSVTLRGLLANTTYRFQLLATNAVGTSYGAVRYFHTLGAAPSALSEPVAAVGTGSAELSGSLDPNGLASTWYFQYGTTGAYGSTTPVVHAGAGTAAVAAHAEISALAGNTTYHFRLVASNSAGTAYGADTTFTTLGPDLSVSRRAVGFGGSVRLSGAVPYGEANTTVTVFERKAGQPSFVGLTTVLSGNDGRWALGVSPKITTSYKVLWHGISSSVVTIRVAPSVTFRTAPVGLILTRVGELRSVRGHLVRLQRLFGRDWRTIEAVRLDAAGRATFHPSLRPGYSELRVYLSAYQAGPGYIAGASAPHHYLKR